MKDRRIARVVGERVLARMALAFACAAGCAGVAAGQQLIGYVSTKDADVAGATDVVDGHAVLAGSVAVTAKDHTAPIALGRGGEVRVCQTSVVHLTQSRSAELAGPLLVSLDRGAIEVDMAATGSDAVMTPDLRFAVRTGGRLDLRMRVARNGDTCVENRGVQAPTLAVTDPFGEALYELLPGQHVLFEHGSLREVVDHERTPCGCPETAGMSVADALLAPGATPGPGGKTGAPPASPESEHPFPAAVSEGLAPAAAVPQAPVGEVHTQVTDVMTYNAEPVASPAPTAAAAMVPAVAAPERSHDVVHVVGRFFRRLFGGS